MTGFFLVWCPTASRTPSYRHDTRDSAQREAERLASENSGCEFFVLAACSRSLRPISVTEQLTYPQKAQNQTPNSEVDDDDIPF